MIPFISSYDKILIDIEYDLIKPTDMSVKQLNTLVYRTLESITLIQKLSGDPVVGGTDIEISGNLEQSGKLIKYQDTRVISGMRNVQLVRYTLDLLRAYKKIVISSKINGVHYITTSASQLIKKSDVTKR